MKRLVNKLNDNCTSAGKGVFNCMNSFCNDKIKSSRCQNFYNNLKNIESDNIYTCPYGFSCIKKNFEIYNCLLLKETYLNKKMKGKKDINQKIFTKEEIYELIEIDEYNEKNDKDFELLFNSMSDFLHDISKVNGMIGTNSRDIAKCSLSKRDASKLDNIYYLSDFITKRIELYRFISNPAMINTGRKRVRNAYKLFDIYRHIFNNVGKVENISIEMNVVDMNGEKANDDITTFEATDSITILPYLLIDNAIKYSQENSIIKIDFYQENSLINKIIVSSNPSYVIMDKPKDLFLRGYRSENNTSKSSGSGLGLDIVKQICDYNGIDVKIDIDCNQNGQQVFMVVMTIGGKE